MKKALVLIGFLFALATGLTAQTAPGTIVSEPEVIMLESGALAVKQEVYQPVTIEILQTQKAAVMDKIAALSKEYDRLKKLIEAAEKINNPIDAGKK